MGIEPTRVKTWRAREKVAGPRSMTAHRSAWEGSGRSVTCSMTFDRNYPARKVPHQTGSPQAGLRPDCRCRRHNVRRPPHQAVVFEEIFEELVGGDLLSRRLLWRRWAAKRWAAWNFAPGSRPPLLRRSYLSTPAAGIEVRRTRSGRSAGERERTAADGPPK